MFKDGPGAMAVVSGLVPAAAEITTWIACDSCNKWRRIPKELADSVKEDAHWCALLNEPFTPLSARSQEPGALHLHGAGGSLLRVTCTSTVLSMVICSVAVAPTPLPHTLTPCSCKRSICALVVV